MNLIDIIAAGIMIVCIVACYKRGLALSIFQFSSFLASLFLTYLFYPVVGRFLRETPVYELFEGIVIETLGIDPGATLGINSGISEVFASFPVPSFLETAISGNNNPEVYQLFGVSTAEGYTASFCTNLMINALSMIIVFVLVTMLLFIVEKALSLAVKLPVISQFDKFGGLVVGVLQGVIMVWLVCSMLSVLLGLSPLIGKDFSDKIDGSFAVGLLFGEGNLILQSLLKSILH